MDYGASIPLGPDWMYGGETSPASSQAAPTGTPVDPASVATGVMSVPPPSGPAAPSDMTAASSSAPSLPTSSAVSVPSSSPLSSLSSSTSASGPSTSQITSPLALLSGSSTTSSSSSSLSTTLSRTSSSASATTSSTPLDGILPLPSDRTSLTVILSSVLGPLFLAIILLALFIWLLRRYPSDYARAATNEPAEPAVITTTPRRASSNHKLPFTPPRSKAAQPGSRIPSEKAPLLTGPAQTVIEEEDITDYANPHPRSSILSRLSLGLGMAPAMRRISNGAAEKAYRTPSWALAGLAALPRRIGSGLRSVSTSTQRAGPYGPPVGAGISEKQPESPTRADRSRGTSTQNNSSGNEDTQPSDPPPSAAYTRSMATEELFFRPPRNTPSSQGTKSSKASSGSSGSGSRGSRSTRGTGPSNWQSAFPALEEDAPAALAYATDTVRRRPGSGYTHQRRNVNTVSVGVPETPRTGAGSIGSWSALGLDGGERERRSRWVEEGDRLDFPVPPDGMGWEMELFPPRSPGWGGVQRHSMASTLSEISNYYSAHSHPETPPPYDRAQEPSTIRLVQPLPQMDEDGNQDTLRGGRPILSSRLSEDQRGSDNTRRSFICEPLLGPPDVMAEFGQLRSVSGGPASTLISALHNSNARSSHYASVQISESSAYSQSSGSSLERTSLRGGTELLAESGATFGVVSDRALRGRQSHATLVSTRSVTAGQARSARSEDSIGGQIPPMPDRHAARPPALPRVSSDRAVMALADGSRAASRDRAGPGSRAERKKSWFGWKKEKGEE
ncbi:uncharacterized protein MKK02DRAFT_40526 [Dioszegia hungarica]|uniref:Uncharacterized protein n=1 Tax=Dioszegia hungarica TaxID=4972 RepID=A0AA38H3R1_9TREE|nr:uncharacterized protein MKK02DRAFT_40526 [Dioszegia hungarica]KAI9632224.1 hypothetical protein MKK02DRAFT_40526 [Dioszegia hungarica]